MCVAVIIPPNKPIPPDPVWLACYSTNPDGCGIAWNENDRVQYHKGLDINEFLTELNKVRTKYPDPQKHPTLFLHFRIASVGGKGMDLTHPFPVSRKAPLDLKGHAAQVVMQNGTWNDWKHTLLCQMHGKLPDGDWSDSRTIAYMLAYHGSNFLSLIDQKVATLDYRGKVQYWGKWEDKNGVLFSNNNHEYRIDKIAKGDSMYVNSKDGKWSKNELGFWYFKEVPAAPKSFSPYGYMPGYTPPDSKSPKDTHVDEVYEGGQWISYAKSKAGSNSAPSTALTVTAKDAKGPTQEDTQYELKCRPDGHPRMWTDDAMARYVLGVHPETVPQNVLVELQRRDMW